MRSSCHPGRPAGPADHSQNQDPQCHAGHCPPGLYIVGIGPGDLTHLSARAETVIRQADSVVGYGLYVDLIRPLITARTVVQTGMTREVARVRKALDLARQGGRVALISSGDPGIYAMAGLAYEIFASLPADQRVAMEVVPGIPALCAGAALLGAPLTHDFAVISLSDLLTPWETIEHRITAAAGADFVIVIYNPKSKKRHWQLARARELMLQARPAETPAGVVTGAMRENQRIQVTSLGRLLEAPVDMQTILFIGNSDTRVLGDCLFTPRGYARKYDVKDS